MSDTGKGMTRDELARAEGTLRTAASGTEEASGLGIRLARQLIEAHGASLELTSPKRVGTRPVITLQ